MNETFAEGELHYNPVTATSTQYFTYAPVWDIVDPTSVNEEIEQTESGYAFYGHTNFNQGDTFITLPKFSTVDANAPGILLTTYATPMASEMIVSACTFGSEDYEVIGSIESPETTLGWITTTIQLPETYRGKEWVEVRLEVNFTHGSSSIALIDAYNVKADVSVGVNNIYKPTCGVAGIKGAITLTGLSGNQVEIINPAGQVIKYGTVGNDNVIVPVSQGIYLVNVGEKTYKVIVR